MKLGDQIEKTTRNETQINQNCYKFVGFAKSLLKVTTDQSPNLD